MRLVSRIFWVLCIGLAVWTNIAPCADYGDPDYRAAVAACDVELTEKRLDNDLWGLSPAYGDHPLQFDEAGRVLMVTWTGEYYDDYVGKEYELAAGFEVWLVPVGQVKSFFGEDRPFTVRRLEQAYGLPPESGYTRMVTMWVHPADLLRPCPDPAVSDNVCEVDFPVGQPVTVAQEYKDWFTSRRKTIYDCSATDCYPWTGLGYTYDWGPDATGNHVGFSEYLKPKGHSATVLIRSVQTTQDYFATALPGASMLLLE